jgi:hypothetical protein
MKKFHVWVFGSDEHFGNFLSKDFDNQKDAEAYVGWLKENLQKAYDRVGEYDLDNAPKSFKKKWGMEENVGTMWVHEVADEVRLIGGDNPANVITSFRATYDSDGDFAGYD